MEMMTDGDTRQRLNVLENNPSYFLQHTGCVKSEERKAAGASAWTDESSRILKRA
jgi:hypothetical protein